jgi:hypothetical protein
VTVADPQVGRRASIGESHVGGVVDKPTTGRALNLDDGRFGVNEFFYDDDTWRPSVPE